MNFYAVIKNQRYENSQFTAKKLRQMHLTGHRFTIQIE